MNMVNIRVLAENVGVNPGRLIKTELIRQIQIFEGNFDCYSTAHQGICDQTHCLWRIDCFDAAPPRRARGDSSS